MNTSELQSLLHILKWYIKQNEERKCFAHDGEFIDQSIMHYSKCIPQ